MAWWLPAKVEHAPGRACGVLIVLLKSRIAIAVLAIATKLRATTATRWPDQLAQQLERYRLLVLGLVLVVYLAGFNGLWQIEPDSALYLSLGRNLARGAGYTYRGEPHAMVLPGLPYALAGCFKLCGAHAIAAADALVLLCGLAAIACTYRLVGLAFGRPTAVVVAIGFACMHEFHRYCYEIMTEAPFVAGVAAFLAGHQAIFGSTQSHPRHRARWWDWLLLLGGLAVGLLIRPNMLPLIVIWLALLLWRSFHRGRRLFAALAALALTVILFGSLVAFMQYQRHAQVPNTYVQTIRQHLQDPGAWLTDTIEPNLRDFCPATVQTAFGFKFVKWYWPNVILGGLVIAAEIALFRYELLWGWWVVAMIATMVLVQAHDRYLLAISPLIVLGWWRLIRRLNARLPAKVGNALFLLLLGLGTTVNFTRVGVLVLRQHRHNFYQSYKQGKFAGAIELAASIGQFVQPQDVIVAPNQDERIYTFLCDHAAYLREEFGGLKRPNHRVVVIVDPPEDDGKAMFPAGTVFSPYPAPWTPGRQAGTPPSLWAYIAQPPN